MKKILALAATLSLCLLTACGGSGSSGSSSGSSTSSVDYISNGSSATCPGSSGSSSANLGTNVASVIVDQGPSCLTGSGTAAVNTLYVTITVCVPGYTDSTHCQTIDHVQVDTGSTGLRILSSVLTVSSFVNTTATSGGALAECLAYVDGVVWGPVTTADVYVGGANAAGSGEKAAGIPMQVIGGKSNDVPATPPSACTTASTTGQTPTVEDTVPTFGANGIIGVGSFQQDCGVCCTAEYSADGCTNSSGATANAGFYYACTSSTCSVTTEELDQQVSNPVGSFSTDNTGVVISLPSVGSTGSGTVSGTLTFGIGTESNNAQPSSATLLWLDPLYGEFQTTYNGATIECPYNGSTGNEPWCSYIDSGSNALYFDDSNITVCTATSDTGFYCPPGTLSESATLTSYSGSPNATGGTNNFAQSISIANAGTLFSTYPDNAAFSNLGGSLSNVSNGGGTGSDAFDWGLPFFYGNNVYVSMQTDAEAENGDSPSIAFTPNNGAVLND